MAQVLEAKLAEDQDSRSFFAMAREVRSLPDEPMTMKEIQAEVDAVRAERGTREAGR